MSSSSKWFYTDNGKDKPRVTMPELLELFNAGSITEKTYVWHKSYCQKWTPIIEVPMIMEHVNIDIETTNNTNNTNRTQPSITRSMTNLPNLPIIKTISGSNTSNNTSSEIQEIAVNDSFGAISESEEDAETTEKTITSIAPHIIDERALPKTKKVQGYRQSISNSFNHSSNSISYYSNSNNNINTNDENYEHRNKKYRISQLVEINDEDKLGTVYGLIADITHKKMVIQYNNKAFGKECFDICDERVSVVTDPLKIQSIQYTLSSEDDAKTDKVSSRVVLPSNDYVYSKSKKRNKGSTKSYSMLHSPSDLVLIRRKSTILNTVNMNEEKLSLLSERKLLNLERDELQREQEKFFYSKKKHETEVWAVKNDYIEQTKKLKKQYNVYKKTCQGIVNNEANSKETNHLLLKYHKLETKEKLIKDSQRSVDKKQKTAQILYQTSSHLLHKVQDATLKLQVYAKLCDEKCDTERELIKKQEIDRKKYLNKMNKLRDEMLSAPWLLLSSTNNTNNHTKSQLNRLHTKLMKTYQGIRDERRRFLPIQRKWAKLIMKHQIYAQDEKAFINVRTKLENIRKYEKEYKLNVFEEIKAMANNKLEEQSIQMKEEEIMLNLKLQLMDDKQRQIRNEKKLLRLQQRNLSESIMELEYERELISAQISKENPKEENYEKFGKAMETLTKGFEQMIATKDEEIKKMQHKIQSWKGKANQEEKEKKKLTKEKKNMQQIITALNNENKELTARNQQLEYTLPQLTIQNEHLSEQIQEMVISSNEALKQHQEIKIRKIERKDQEEETKTYDLLAIDDETENMLSDASNYEETAAALSSIRSQLANSDETGRLITSHESQHSMTAIVDLVKKTKENMESQRVDLEILADRPSSADDADDSYSDHLFTIENMLNNTTATTNVYSGESNDSTDEPPMFWNHNDDLQNDECILQKLISDPNQVLNDVMSPSARICALYDDDLSSDWDKGGSNDSNDDSNLKLPKKTKKSKKKSKHKKGKKSVDKKYGKIKKKRSKKSIKD